MIQKLVKKRNESSKLHPNFYGPFVIVAQKTPSIYVLKANYFDPASKHEQVHIEKMKRYFDPTFYRRTISPEKVTAIENPDLYDQEKYLESEDEENQSDSS